MQRLLLSLAHTKFTSVVTPTLAGTPCIAARSGGKQENLSTSGKLLGRWEAWAEVCSRSLETAEKLSPKRCCSRLRIPWAAWKKQRGEVLKQVGSVTPAADSCRRPLQDVLLGSLAHRIINNKLRLEARAPFESQRSMEIS